MNNEQLQDWLTELCAHFSRITYPQQPQSQQQQNGGDHSTSSSSSSAERRAIEHCRRLLIELTPKTQILLNYLACNFEDVRLSQPLVGQLLALYYRLGTARTFVLQLLPSLIQCYLIGVSRRWRNCIDLFEMFFLAVYNEEILAGGVGSASMTKKVEEIRIPSVRCPSIYHDPSRLNLPAGGERGCVQSTVRVGPYPAVGKVIAENRYLILTRLMRSFNSCLSQMAPDVACRSLCLMLVSVCRSGFTARESDFRQRVLREVASDEVFGDYTKKARMAASPHFLVECMNGVNYALFNGHADAALRALDAIHQRAQFELFPDVLLQTNALRNSLLDPQTVKMLMQAERS